MDLAAAGITVRTAAPADVEAIRAIAETAWRATYAGLIDADAIERFLAVAYAPARVELRLARHDVLVAFLPGDAQDGAAAAFAETAMRDDHLQLVAIYALPDARGRGLGTALLDEVLRRHPGQPLAADVLVGNALGEPFYIARGFEPGETLVEEIAGVPIRERRWWRRPPGLFDTAAFVDVLDDAADADADMDAVGPTEAPGAAGGSQA
jgi:GNAT superfamily N-acetyltransferase